MQISLDSNPNGFSIRSYSPGEVRIRGAQIATGQVVLRRSVVVTPERLLEEWAPQRFEELMAEHWLPVAALRPELVLIGSGPGFRFPSMEIVRPLMEAGIGFEVMDTGAACRTYNVLAIEGRMVAAALIIA